MTPTVSVVMGVYNGAARIEDSIASVLAQEEVPIELVIVDDGSTDATPTILERLACGNPRIRVLRQENAGLTQALIRGCQEAQGEYIARQDCGDLSLAGRFAKQLRALQARPDACMVSCATRYVGPADEFLYNSVCSDEDATDGLLTLDLAALRGPSHHGSVMLSRSYYEEVGGYRAPFYFAQDLDLWTRLAERGRHVALREVLYQARLDARSLSGRHRARQVEIASLILECAALRRQGRSEAAVLARAGEVRPRRGHGGGSGSAGFWYFIGVCLQKQGAPGARTYFLKALRRNPLHLKSAVRLLTGARR